MKNRPLPLILVIVPLLLAGCGILPIGEDPTALPEGTADPGQVPTESLPPATATVTPVPIDAWIRDSAHGDIAMRLGVDVTSVEVVSMTPQDWPDSCLGMPSGTADACVKTITPGYRVVLNAAGHTHEYRATTDGSLIVYSGPVTITAPEPCMVHGISFIYSPEDGYCFAYPVSFHRLDGGGPITLYGPTYGPGPEPLSASMSLEVRPLNPNEDLMAVVVGYVASLGEMSAPLTRTTITVGGEQAEMLEIVPGRLGSRDVFLIHNGLAFHFIFHPAPAAAGEAAPDVEALYQAVINSMVFVS